MRQRLVEEVVPDGVIERLNVYGKYMCRATIRHESFELHPLLFALLATGPQHRPV